MGMLSIAVAKLGNFTGSIYAITGPVSGSVGPTVNSVAKGTIKGHFRPLGSEEMAVMSGGLDVQASHVLVTDDLGAALQGDRITDANSNTWAVVNVSRVGFSGEYIYRVYLRARA